MCLGWGGKTGAENFSFLLDLSPDFLQIRAEPRYVHASHDRAVLLAHLTAQLHHTRYSLQEARAVLASTGTGLSYRPVSAETFLLFLEPQLSSF